MRIGTPRRTPPFDWNDRTTWPEALRDMRAAYITYYPDIAIPGAVEAVGAMVNAAVLPAGDIAEPFVDGEDIADVAFDALTEEGHSGKLYEVTGPRLLR